MSVFNKRSRTDNSIKTSFVSTSSLLLKIFMGFFYRSMFLRILSSAYLGINGLFSNVLQILALAELGITGAIVYRFYEPISKDDIVQVGKIMNYFKKVYRTIAVIILSLGLALLPFIHLLINDEGEIPSDINLQLVYVLFLLNSVATYLYAYKLSLLTADQRHYNVALVDLIVTALKYGLQMVMLLITHNYTLTLVVGIFATLLCNFTASMWVTKQYKEVFEVKETLSKEETKSIMADTRATMYHKIGNTVLNGTDNAVLTKMVSLTATGLYSNYSLIIMYIQNFVSQLMGNLTSSIGNASQIMAKNEFYWLYKKINFVCLSVTSIIVTGCYTCIDDFISVWVGKEYLLSKWTTLVICIQLYINLSRTINSSFINATGLFVKDRIRPLIESVINLVISILLVKEIGITGVFLGTIISLGLTAFWREPYLLYKHVFKTSFFDYWMRYLSFILLTAWDILIMIFLKSLVPGLERNIIYFLVEGSLSVIISVCFISLVMRKKEEMSFLKGLAGKVVSKVTKR